MTIQKNFQTNEVWITDTVGPMFRSYLLDKKRAALAKGMIIPDDLIAEMEDFSERNTVVELEKKNDGKICCPRCLKAYALTKAREFGLPKGAYGEIGKMIKGEVGHNGYYLDAERVVKMPEI